MMDVFVLFAIAICAMELLAASIEALRRCDISGSPVSPFGSSGISAFSGY